MSKNGRLAWPAAVGLPCRLEWHFWRRSDGHRHDETAWTESEIVQQPVGQLPWGHIIVLLTRLKAPEERLAYGGM